MPPLPVLPGARVVRVLEKAGFMVVRVRGSHHVLRHPDGRGTSVPVHGNQDVRVGTLRGIMRDCGLTADEFLNLLDLRPVQVHVTIGPERRRAMGLTPIGKELNPAAQDVKDLSSGSS